MLDRMRWRASAGIEFGTALWAHRGDGLIFLDDADGVDKLRKALPAPHLDWIQEGGAWAISITSAYALWMDMINMPSVKDVGWAGAGYAFDEKLIDPTLAFARCWPHVLEAMTSEDWKVPKLTFCACCSPAPLPQIRIGRHAPRF